MNLINTNIFQAVVTTAKAKAAQHPAWLRAIDKAAAELLHPFTYWAFADGVLTMQSPTSGKLYRIDDAHTCEAAAVGRPCKHRAARQLMVRYHEALTNMPSPAPVKPSTIAPPRRSLMDEAARTVYAPRTIKGETYHGIDI